MVEYHKELIATYSKRFDLSAYWIKAIIMKESAWKVQAIRYEPNYRWLYKPEVFSKISHITLDTETVTQKMSWGLGQIMGAVFREQGHNGLMPEVLDPELNIKHMCIKLSELSKKLKGDSDSVFAAYNGGMGAVERKTDAFPNQGYVDAVNSYMIKYHQQN